MRISTLAKIAGILCLGLMLGAGLSVLVKLQDSVIPPLPTETPGVIYVPVYPTVIPTEDVPLPPQCATTGGDYQVVYTGQTPNIYYEVYSPDKRSRVHSDTQGVYLDRPDGTTLTVYQAQSEYPLPYVVYWSP